MAKKRRRRSFRFTREGKVFVSVTMGVGLAAGLLPAIQAMRLKIVDALRSA